VKIITKALIASGLAILIIIGIPVLRFVYEMAIWSYYDRKQMAAGKRYMDSLTHKDIQAWIQRTQKYLTEYPPTNFDEGLDSNSIPPDLQKLGMIGIEVETNYVDYSWLAGIDDTSLYVERMSNGVFQVFAVYTPYSNRMIWPKQ
jgi:hypothetical protein